MLPLAPRIVAWIPPAPPHGRLDHGILDTPLPGPARMHVGSRCPLPARMRVGSEVGAPPPARMHVGSEVPPPSENAWHAWPRAPFCLCLDFML